MQNENFTTIRTNVKPLSNEYEVKLDRDLTAPEHFHEELETIRVATEADVVILRLSTDGGRADTMKAFLKAINTSPAYFIADVQGDIASAGGPLMLACDEVQLGEFSSLMIHTVQTGYGGAGHNMKKFSDHISKDARNIIETCYEGFLTQEEIEQVLVGEELWLDCEEIVSRMAAREVYREDQLPPLSKEDVDLEFETVYGQLTEFSASIGLPLEDVLPRLVGMLPQTTEDTTKGVETEDWSYKFLDTKGNYFNIDYEGYINFGEGNYKNFTSIYEMEGYGSDWFKLCADMMDVKYAHNISPQKLVIKLDEKVKELVAELNK